MALGDNNGWERGDRPGGYFTADPRAPVIIHEGPSRELATDWWQEEPQPESQFNLLQYWRILLKRRLLIAIAFVVCVAIGVAATMLMTPIYSARTTLQIDREAAKVLNTDDVTPNDRSVGGEEFFQTQYGLLKSRSLAIRVTESLNLANNDFLSKMGVGDDAFKGSPQEIAAARKSLAVAIIEGKLSVEPVRGSRLVKVSFSSPDPVLSARVANAVADNFIESNLALRFESSAYARDFLEQRLKLLKPRLEESERQLVAYAASQQIINVAAAPNQTGNDTSGGATQSLTANNLVALNSSLAAAKGERIRTEQRWRQVQSTSGRSLPEVLQSPTIQQLSQSRAQLMASYQEKLSTYKPDYPLMLQLKAQIDEIDRQIQAEINNVRESLRANYNIALNQERALSQQVEGLKSSFLDLRNRSIEYTILQREVDTNRSQYEALLQRYKDVTVAGGVVSNNISVVDRAEVPEAPSKPRPLLNIALAMLMGLGLGVVAAFIAEAFDDAINAPEDVESKLDLPVLGTVPVLDKGTTPKEALADLRSAFSEAYYSIRTALQFSTTDGVPRSLLLTSARPSEGKSTSAVSIAQNFARLDMRVLLIDGDLRNPSLHRNMVADNNVGLSSVLTNAVSLDDAIQESAFQNLFLVTCGPLPPNPAELLAGTRLRALLAEAGAKFDLVIVDGPPVMGLADAPMLAATVAGTVLVIEAGGTRRGLAKTAARRLAVGRAKLLGVVLTKFNARKQSYGSGYAYAYEYSYGQTPRVAGKS